MEAQRQYYAAHKTVITSALDAAVSDTMEKQPADPVLHLGEHLITSAEKVEAGGNGLRASLAAMCRMQLLAVESTTAESPAWRGLLHEHCARVIEILRAYFDAVVAAATGAFDEEAYSASVTEVLRASVLVKQWPSAVSALALRLGLDDAALLTAEAVDLSCSAPVDEPRRRAPSCRSPSTWRAAAAR